MVSRGVALPAPPSFQASCGVEDPWWSRITQARCSLSHRDSSAVTVLREQRLLLRCRCILLYISPILHALKYMYMSSEESTGQLSSRITNAVIKTYGFVRKRSRERPGGAGHVRSSQAGVADVESTLRSRSHDNPGSMYMPSHAVREVDGYPKAAALACPWSQ